MLDELRISDQFPVGARDFPLLPVYTGYWAQPTLYSMGNGGSFLGEKRPRNETTIKLHIMLGAIPPFPPKLALALPPTRTYVYPLNSLKDCRIYSRPALALTSFEGACRFPTRPWVLPPARVLNALTPVVGGLPRDIPRMATALVLYDVRCLLLLH